MAISEKLKELREKRGLSQAELSEKIGLSKGRIGNYECGTRVPDYETLEIFADFYNVDINYLLGREGASTYYLDPEAAELAQAMFDRPELKVLFDATRNVSKEDIQFVIEMLGRINKQ